MSWEVPSFTEVRMDSEIGAYQDDFKDLPEGKEQSENANTQPPHPALSPVGRGLR